MGTHNGAAALSASETGDWVQAHAALSRLSRERAALDVEEGRWLLRAWRSAVHVHLGYGSFARYVESLFGYKPRTTQEKLRVAEALETLPRLAGALEAGALSWCAARELTRVALPDTESVWLDAARGKTLRELEALVASKAPGDTPDAPATELPRPRVLRFEVAADTFATFREAVRQLQRSAGGAWTTTPSCSRWHATSSAGLATTGAAATRSRSTSAPSVATACSQRQARSCGSTRPSSAWPPATPSTSVSSCRSQPHRRQPTRTLSRSLTPRVERTLPKLAATHAP